MNMFSPRTRGLNSQKKFADSAKAAKAAQARGNFGGIVKGKFDRLILGEKSIWLRIAPEQSFCQKLYDKHLKKVIETGTEEHPARPWFEFKTHYVVSTKRPHNCSSGPERDSACRGCANRAMFFDNQRAKREKIKESTGMDVKEKADPPVQESTRYAMPVTVLEKIFEMEVLDNKGKARTNKEGKPITNSVPAPLSGLNPQKQKEKGGEFGHNYHWAFGPVHLGHLSTIDTMLWNSCASCASALMAVEFSCPECEQVMYQDDNGVTGTELKELRETVLKCPHCGCEKEGIPNLICTGCDNPVEGSILAFDLRLHLEYDEEDDKKSTIILDEFRLPNYEKYYDAKTAERVYELLYSPLDIVLIFAPEDVSSQAFAYPEDLKKTNPTYHIDAKKKRKDAEPYGAETEGEGDPDQMPFGQG